MTSNREEQFILLLRLFAPDLLIDETFEMEFKAIPNRKFRWDFKIGQVLIEIQGATWVKGAHSSGAGIRRDCEKLNLATVNGWKLLSFTSDMLDNDGQGCIDMVRKALT